MKLNKIIFIALLSILLWGCGPIEEDTGAYNANINGHWSQTSDILSDNCTPANVGQESTVTFVLGEDGFGNIYVDGTLDPDTSYDDGTLTVVSFNINTNYQYTKSLSFTDNDHATGTSSETLTINGTTCIITSTVTLTRI